LGFQKGAGMGSLPPKRPSELCLCG
jgi:hypothetical protein